MSNCIRLNLFKFAGSLDIIYNWNLRPLFYLTQLIKSDIDPPLFPPTLMHKVYFKENINCDLKVDIQVSFQTILLFFKYGTFCNIFLLKFANFTKKKTDTKLLFI